MAAETYTGKVIVLRKTKLGESDLVLTLLAEDGSQLRAVAKGARKPSNSFAARLELYSAAEVLCSKGRSLDIVKEARLIDAHEKLRFAMEHAAGAAPMVELLDKVTQQGLASPRLYGLTRAAFSCLVESEVSKIPALTAAHLLKTLAFVGLRPSLTACASCGGTVALDDARALVRVSCQEGGALCGACGQQAPGTWMPAGICRWACSLLFSPLAEVKESTLDVQGAYAVLDFCRAWIREHVGCNLRSLDFLFATDLFT
ncbi:MAG: DNA repair protein RecO [Eggerthellaceae bacterium]|nr:DNA repair protein RecO [Eggerthellaceae bacterium]